MARVSVSKTRPSCEWVARKETADGGVRDLLISAVSLASHCRQGNGCGKDLVPRQLTVSHLFQVAGAESGLPM